MNECTYKSFDELPLMLNVVQMAAVLGISRAGTYRFAVCLEQGSGRRIGQ